MLFSKLSLFTIGCVLMDNALGSGFVDNAHKGRKHLLGFLELERIDGVVELSYGVSHLGAKHFVLERFLFDHEHSFLCRLDIRHDFSPRS